MSVTIKPVTTKKEMKQFICFNYELYKDSPYAVPDLYNDVRDTLDPEKNAAYKFCEAQPFLAFREDKVVGRIVAIINHKANARWEKKVVRFGWVDFIDDAEVVDALFATVEQWGKERGMDTIVGPLGFTDLDQEGMLFEGYDQMGSMYTMYNYPYYNDHLKTLGFEEDAVWVDRRIKLPNINGENSANQQKFFRVAKLVEERYGFKVHRFKNKKELKESGYILKVFDIINKAYQNLYGTTDMTQRQVEQYANMYLPYLDTRLISIIDNKEGEPVAMGICMPSLTKAIQKAKSKMLPFGWWHMAKALYLKHSSTLDLLLIGTLPEYQDTGCISLIFADMITAAQKMGFDIAECCPQLETNSKALSVWRSLDTEVTKRRHTWKKSI